MNVPGIEVQSKLTDRPCNQPRDLWLRRPAEGTKQTVQSWHPFRSYWLVPTSTAGPSRQKDPPDLKVTSFATLMRHA